MAEDCPNTKLVSLLKSLLHNIGVVMVGFLVAVLGARSDPLLGWPAFKSFPVAATGCALIIVGFLLWVWATFLFYERRMKVISLAPQKRLITTGPYRFSRNPLYLGGNGLIFGGAALFLRCRRPTRAAVAQGVDFLKSVLAPKR
jgi:protein-S-isoprenylcysteine O-methyltransferase Ste14